MPIHSGNAIITDLGYRVKRQPTRVRTVRPSKSLPMIVRPMARPSKDAWTLRPSLIAPPPRGAANLNELPKKGTHFTLDTLSSIRDAGSIWSHSGQCGAVCDFIWQMGAIQSRSHFGGGDASVRR